MLPSAMTHTNTSIQIRNVIKKNNKTLRWRVSIPHIVYVWAGAHEMHVSRVYVGYITTSLHGRLLGQREVLLFYITAFPFSSLLLSALLCLCPHTTSSTLCSSLCSPHSHLCSVDFSASPSFRAILTDSQTLSGGSGWPVHYTNSLSAPISALLKHHGSTVIHICMKLNTHSSAGHLSHTHAHTHTHTRTQMPLPGHGGPICRICQDLTGNGDQSQLSSYVSLTCCCQKINPILIFQEFRGILCW